MSTYREAIAYARAGGTIKRGNRVVRFITEQEAEPILLVQSPARSIMRDDDLKSARFGKALVKDGQIVVATHAPKGFDVRRMGLHDISGAEPTEFRPTDEDIYVVENGALKLDEDGNRILATDWVREGIDDVEPPAPEPEPVAPEVVDEVLAEHHEPIIEDPVHEP